MRMRELRIITIVEYFKRFYDIDFIECNILVLKLSIYTDSQLRNLERTLCFTDFSKFTFGGMIDFITLHNRSRNKEGK